MKSISIRTRDTSTVAVPKYLGTPLPVFPAGKTVRVVCGERAVELVVGTSTPYQLAGVKQSPSSKALHHLLSSAARTEGMATVTIEWDE
jgi:hypothetical protein